MSFQKSPHKLQMTCICQPQMSASKSIDKTPGFTDEKFCNHWFCLSWTCPCRFCKRLYFSLCFWPLTLAMVPSLELPIWLFGGQMPPDTSIRGDIWQVGAVWGSCVSTKSASSSTGVGQQDRGHIGSKPERWVIKIYMNTEGPFGKSGNLLELDSLSK